MRDLFFRLRYLFKALGSPLAPISLTFRTRHREVESQLVRMKRQKAWMLKHLEYGAKADVFERMTLPERAYARQLLTHLFECMYHLDLAIKSYETSLASYNLMIKPKENYRPHE